MSIQKHTTDVLDNPAVKKIITRAIDKKHFISAADIAASPKMREVGEWMIESHHEDNEFLLSLQLKAWNGTRLSNKEVAAAFRVFVTEQSRYKNQDHTRPQLPNGTYTVIKDRSLKHRTIRLEDCPEKYSKPQGTQIASFLGGPDNESDYVGFAFVLPGRQPQIWKRFLDNFALCQNLGTLLEHETGLPYGEQYALESNRCWRCNRVLTVDVSIHNGLGPICAKKLGITRKALSETPTLTARGMNNIIIDNDELFEDIHVSQ